MLNGIFPSALFVTHQGQLGGRGLSPRLWARIAGEDMSPDGMANGAFAGDEFYGFDSVNPGTGGTTSGVTPSGSSTYSYFMDLATNAGSIKPLTNTGYGAIQLATGTVANYQAQLSACGGGVLGQINDAAGSGVLTVFEARFQVGQIGNAYNAFIGLSDPGLITAASLIANGGGLVTTVNLAGFNVNQAAGNTLSFIYQANGQTIQTPIASVGTLVAATWYKVGFIYNPLANLSSRLKVYFNNVQVTPSISGTSLQAATFPSTAYMTFTAAVKSNGTGAANTLALDWWDWFQAGQYGDGD